MSETEPDDTRRGTTADDNRRRDDREQMGGRQRDTGAMKWLPMLTALLGAWLVLSPFLLTESMAEVSDAMLWNNVIIGASIFLLAAYNYYRMSQGYSVNVARSSIVALLGLWMLLSPFIFDAANQALFWSNVITGLLVSLMAAYNAYAGRETAAPRTTETM